MNEDGQHRAYGSGAPGASTGQRSKLMPGAYVGNECGPEMNMKVPATKKDADCCSDSDCD